MIKYWLKAFIILLIYIYLLFNKLSEQFCIVDDSYEKNAFWIFVHIMQKKNWRDLMKNGLPKLSEMLNIF